MNINGNWIGTLIYETGYSENTIGKELTFELTINESEGEITGHGKDVSGFGVNPSPFTIKGFIEDSTISFIKQYQSNAYFDINDNLKIESNKPSPEITYNGIYNNDTAQFEGEWDILLEQQQKGDNFLDYECTGSWIMKKNN